MVQVESHQEKQSKDSIKSMKIFIDDIGKCDLVYDTIKVGFPEGEVVKIDGRYGSHHATIKYLISTEQEPFWIVDTDVIFYSAMPEPPKGIAMLGEYQPSFWCPITGKLTQARLDPACMYVDPIKFCKDWNAYSLKAEVPHYAPLADPIAPCVIGIYFFDILAAARFGVDALRMSQQYLDCFVHLHCGSWLETASQHIPGLAKIHANPPRTQEDGMKLRAAQREFYRTHAPQ